MNYLDTTVNCNLYSGSCLCDKTEEIFQSSLLNKSFALTSLSAHTEQEKHRVRSKAGNNQQQDTKNHKIFTIKHFYRTMNFQALRMLLLQKLSYRISSFYGFCLLTMVHMVSDLPNLPSCPGLQDGHNHGSLCVHLYTNTHPPVKRNQCLGNGQSDNSSDFGTITHRSAFATSKSANKSTGSFRVFSHLSILFHKAQSWSKRRSEF